MADIHRSMSVQRCKCAEVHVDRSTHAMRDKHGCAQVWGGMSVGQYWCAGVQMHRDTGVQGYRCAKVQVHMCTKPFVHGSKDVQGCVSAYMQVEKCTCAHKLKLKHAKVHVHNARNA